MNGSLRELIRETIRRVTANPDHTYADLEDALTEALSRMLPKK